MQLCDYFSRTFKHYLGDIWPNAVVEMYQESRSRETTFKLGIRSGAYGIYSYKSIDLNDITMLEFDKALMELYRDFYNKTRVALVCKSFVDSTLKTLTPD